MLQLHGITKRPYFCTLCGLALSLVAVLIWLLTFEPHGGPKLSMYLFPLSVITLKRIYPAQSVPVASWYGAMLLHWVLVGAAIDFLRLTRRR